LEYQGVAARNERIVRLIAFIFCTWVARYTSCRLDVFQREGVAIDHGNHHGGGVWGWNSYSGLHRCVYHSGSTTEKLFSFPTISIKPKSFSMEDEELYLKNVRAIKQLQKLILGEQQ